MFVTARSSVLCSVCKSIFDYPIGHHIDRPRHETFESLQKAVQHGCYVCSRVWADFSNEHKSALEGRHMTWVPMDCDLDYCKPDKDRRVLSLSFRHKFDHATQGSFTRFWMTPHDDEKYQSMTQSPDMEDTTSSPRTFEQIRKWCISCRENHQGCDQFVQRGVWNPTRLIHIGLHEESEWELHLFENCDPHTPEYITLSYRWGSDDGFKLTDEKLQSGFRGRIEDLPRTFMDAVRVARLFSVRYLWIDRLCIIQDSKLDWEYESLQMRRVYANSFCNIAASASTSPKGGLFRTRNPENTQPGCVAGSFAMSGTSTYNLIVDSYLKRQVLAGPLHRRGWVFQERILAPRTIHFAEDQVFWECFMEANCEAFPDGIPLTWSTKHRFDFSKLQQAEYADRLNIWSSLVKEYTQCAFTKESDKLVAFSGIVNLFQAATGDTYVAGLWQIDLAKQLSWQVLEPALKTSSQYCAPSWSWASTTGPVDPGFLIFDPPIEPQIHITILDVLQTHKWESDSLGNVSAGLLVLEGTPIEATWIPARGSICQQVKIGSHELVCQMRFDSLESEPGKSRTMVCLPIKTQKILMQALLSDGSRAPTTFKYATSFLALEERGHEYKYYSRIGHFQLLNAHWVEDSGIKDDSDGRFVYSTDGEKITHDTTLTIYWGFDGICIECTLMCPRDTKFNPQNKLYHLECL